jgi:GH25 family lysozyme M1 (1,4-beta-N-acetylmuramidase)
LIRAPFVLAFLVACSGEQATFEYSDLEQAATVCGSGPTVKGIDVSYYQPNIDWTKVRADGVRYAFIRVSDGLATVDTKFASHWAGSRAAGIKHGAYQFFRPNQDPIAQADLLLAKIGTPEPDDLPPVIDVEADGGLPPAQVAAKVKLWIDHVSAATGQTPIIYTGFYFWRDRVGAPAFAASSPLWHAQYTSAACPTIAQPWDDWAFWQYTSSGTINGISGPVDTNRFNGTFDDLMALTPSGGAPVAPCAKLPADGGTIDDGDACFSGGGPATSMRHVTTAGEGGDLVWTYTTEDATEGNYGEWSVDLTEAGTYKVEVYTAGAFAESTRARYEIRANGSDVEATIDQSAADGWQTLGTFEFAAGGDQAIHLGDNTGEQLVDKVQLVFDAVKLTRVIPGDDFIGDGDDTDGEPAPTAGGCSASGGGVGSLFGAMLVGLIGLVRCRRSR